MMFHIQAIFEGGVLRPLTPLSLADGDTVQLTLDVREPAQESLSEDDITKRLSDAKSIAEWVEATKLLPSDDGGYDILRSLNENRIWSGERPLISREDQAS